MIKSNTGKYLGNCKECVIRVDHMGNLLYKNQDGSIYAYNPFEKRIVIETENNQDINHVSFKNGIAYGLSIKKEGEANGGIYWLQETMKWKLVLEGNFVSFEALNDKSGFDFIILK